MGLRGPKAKSYDERELEGNPANRPLPEIEEKHQKIASIPEPPWYLDDGAKAVYLDVCGTLHSAGLLTDADLHAIELYADAFSGWIIAIRRRDAYYAEFGNPSPQLVKQCRELANDCNKWMRVLGLGPAYRKGLEGHYGIGGQSTNDEVDDPIIRGICG